MAKERLLWVDQARSIAMVCVYIAHCGIRTYYNALFVYIFIPIFFFLSGYLKSDNYDGKKLVARIAKRLIIPYAFFSSIPYLLRAIKRLDVNVCLDMVIDIVTGRGMWFFACLIVLEIISFGYDRLCRKLYVDRLVASIIAIVLGVLFMYVCEERSGFYWFADTSIACLSFYYSGYIYRIYEAELTVKKEWAVLSLLFFVAVSFIAYTQHLYFNVSTNQFTYPIVHFVMASWGVFSVVSVLKCLKLKMGWGIGRETIWLFGMNAYLLMLSRKVCGLIGLNGLNDYILVPVVVALALIVGYWSVKPVKRYFPSLIGQIR